MNPPNGSPGGQRSSQPLKDAAQAPSLTHTLFRIFILVVLGAFFVFQLDISYLWLVTLLTAVGLVLGIMVLIRTVKYKEGLRMLFGTIAGLMVATLMVVVILTSAVFFNQFREYQQCGREALTERAASQCRTQLDNSVYGQLPWLRTGT